MTYYREQYGLLIEKNTPVAMKIIMAFSKKMRYLDEALVDYYLRCYDDSITCREPTQWIQAMLCWCLWSEGRRISPPVGPEAEARRSNWRPSMTSGTVP